MKKLRLFVALVTMFTTAFALNACENQVVEPVDADYETGFVLSRAELPFGATVVNFMAGQHYVAGTITVHNDLTNLYVDFVTVDGWQLKATHLYVGDPALVPVNKQGSPQNGHFPYKSSHDPRVTSYTVTIPLDELPQCMMVAAHAEVVKVDAKGKVIDSQTAWGQGSRFVEKGNWSMYFEYCKVTPPQDDPDTDFYYGGAETAWAAGGGKYNQTGGGNWATYVYYNDEEVTFDIFAGQTMHVGTATLSPAADGKVKISIIFNTDPESTDTWLLNPETTESVKIQDYPTAPSGNPAPGQFNAYKGVETEVLVPANNFYGIHLDVVKIIPAPVK